MYRVLKPEQVSHLRGSRATPKPAPSNRERTSAPQERVRAAAVHAELLRQVKEDAARIRAAAERFALAAAARAEAAEDELARLREEARAEGFAAGHKEGYEAGFAAGRAAAMAQMEEILNTVKDVAAAARAERQRLLNASRADLVKLAVAIAEKILVRELAADPTFPAAAVESLLGSPQGQGAVRLRLAPRTVARWQEQAQEVVDRLRLQLGVDVVEDPALQPGDFLLETDWGFIDGRLQERWTRILSALNLIGASAGAPPDE